MEDYALIYIRDLQRNINRLKQQKDELALQNEKYQDQLNVLHAMQTDYNVLMSNVLKNR